MISILFCSEICLITEENGLLNSFSIDFNLSLMGLFVICMSRTQFISEMQVVVYTVSTDL